MPKVLMLLEQESVEIFHSHPSISHLISMVMVMVGVFNPGFWLQKPSELPCLGFGYREPSELYESISTYCLRLLASILCRNFDHKISQENRRFDLTTTAPCKLHKILARNDIYLMIYIGYNRCYILTRERWSRLGCAT